MLILFLFLNIAHCVVTRVFCLVYFKAMSALAIKSFSNVLPHRKINPKLKWKNLAPPEIGGWNIIYDLHRYVYINA